MRPVMIFSFLLLFFFKREKTRTYFEASGESIAWYDDGNEYQGEGEDENGKENENGNEEVDRQSRQSVGHDVPTTES